ncbi:MAG: hypothetical protein WAL59_31255 [Roseiarcus sp.]
MRTFLIAAALVIVSSGAPVRAEDNPACAKFENPLEYNACLAKLGPKAGATLAVPESAGVAPAVRIAPATRGVRSMHAFAAPRRSNGRVRMEFTVTPR